MSDRKIPQNEVPIFKVPKDLCQAIRKIEHKISRLHSQYERSVRPLKDQMDDLVQDFREKHGLPGDFIVDTANGLIVLIYPANTPLKDLPELPEIEEPGKNIPE